MICRLFQMIMINFDFQIISHVTELEFPLFKVNIAILFPAEFSGNLNYKIWIDNVVTALLVDRLPLSSNRPSSPPSPPEKR